MHKFTFLFSLSVLFLVGCVWKKTPQPQVVYDDTKSDTLTMENVLADTSKVLVTGLPVYLDSTDVLIHPIGWEDIYRTYNNRLGKIVPDSYASDRISKNKAEESTSSYDVYSNNVDNISGDIVNLIFEDIETGKQKILTDKVLLIRRVEYLKELSKKTDRHYLLYAVYDKDYNRDGKLDGLDMVAYYMSNLDGTNFTQITKDYHFFDRSKFILANNRYYFRTIEDVNKDGEFTKKDMYHHYYIDLKCGSFEPIEYFPLKLMNIE